MFLHRVWAWTGLVMATVITPAAGQSAGPPTVPDSPLGVATSVGDWSVRCVSIRPSGHACEATQIVLADRRPLAQVAIGRAAPAGELVMTVLVPLNASFSVAPHLVGYGPAWTTPALDFRWMRCLPGGCIAVAVPPAETLQRLRARIPPIRLGFLDGEGRDAVLQISVRGLTRALAVLAEKESG